MEQVRTTWTDQRLDDMARRMDDGFNRVDQDIRALRAEMSTRFDSLNRTMIQLGGGMIATFVVGFVGILVAQLA